MSGIGVDVEGGIEFPLAIGKEAVVARAGEIALRPPPSLRRAHRI